jgi:hypothetical protein
MPDACPLYGVVSWLGYLGRSAMGDWDSLYFFSDLKIFV